MASFFQEYDDFMTGVSFENGQLSLNNKGKMDTLQKHIINVLGTSEEFTTVKNNMFVAVSTMRNFPNDAIMKTVEKFPELTSVSMNKEEFSSLVSPSKIDDILSFVEMIKDDAEIYLLHLYLTFSRRVNIDTVKKLLSDSIKKNVSLFPEGNWFPQNVFMQYIFGCIMNSYIFKRCNGEVLKFLMEPELVDYKYTSTFYVTVEDCDPEILRTLVINDEMKNKILEEDSEPSNDNSDSDESDDENKKWTLLHALIWNSTWTCSPDEAKDKRYECYKILTTPQNIHFKDNEGRTPLDLYNYVFSFGNDETDNRIVDLLTNGFVTKTTEGEAEVD